MKTVRLRANLSRELLEDGRWVPQIREREKLHCGVWSVVIFCKAFLKCSTGRWADTVATVQPNWITEFQKDNKTRPRGHHTLYILEFRKATLTDVKSMQLECSGPAVGPGPPRHAPVAKAQGMVSKATRLRRSEGAVPRPRQ